MCVALVRGAAWAYAYFSYRSPRNVGLASYFALNSLPASTRDSSAILPPYCQRRLQRGQPFGQFVVTDGRPFRTESCPGAWTCSGSGLVGVSGAWSSCSEGSAGKPGFGASGGAPRIGAKANYPPKLIVAPKLSQIVDQNYPTEHANLALRRRPCGGRLAQRLWQTRP